MTDWLLRLARWIAGRDRTDWAAAMAAEAEAHGRLGIHASAVLSGELGLA